MADGEPGFFGTSTHSKRLRANTSALLFTVYSVVLTGCAGATSGVFGSFARSSTAEGNDEVIWSSPVSFSTGTAVVHAILLVTSISLTIVLFLCRNTDRKKLAIALLACGILVLIGVVVFGVGWAMIYLNEPLVQRIEEACATFDDACADTFMRPKWLSLIMEVAALILAIWLLAAVAIYRKAPPDPKPGSDSHDDEKHLLDGSTSHSLGRCRDKDRHDSRYSKSGGSRRDKYDDAYIMSKKSSRRSRAAYYAEYDDRSRSHRSNRDERERGRSRSQSRSMSRRDVAQMQHEAERALRSLSHVARGGGPDSPRRESRSRSRSRVRSESRGREREVRALGKERRKSGSRSRSRRRDESSDASSSSTDGQRRTRSRERRRRSRS